MTRIAEGVYRRLGTRFGVAEVPVHAHTGIDTNPVSFQHLASRTLPIHWTLPGITAATATNYGVIWTAPFACTVIGMTEVHQTAGTDAGAVTLQLEKLTSTQAPDAGVSLLATAFSLKATINVVQTGSLVNTAAASGVRYVTLAKGDRLCLRDAGVLADVANVTVVITVQY